MNRKTLVNALETLYPSVSSKPILDEMGDFRIADKVLRSSNGLTQTQVTLPEPTGLNLRVKADKFFRLLRSLPDDDITMSVEGNDLTIKGGKSTAKYVTSPAAEYLDGLDFDIPSWNPLPKGLVKGLKLCVESASGDVRRGVLCGALADGEWLVGSDGYRISRIPAKLPLEKPVVLTADLVRQVFGHSASVDGWAVKGDVMYFKVGESAIVAGKLITGDYPDVKPFFAEAEKLAGTVTLPESLKAGLKRHLEQQGELPTASQDMLVKLDGDEITTTSTDKTTYSLTETAKLDKAVEKKLSFKVHPAVLLEILDRTRAMRYEPGLEFVLFENTMDDGTFQYLACVESA